MREFIPPLAVGVMGSAIAAFVSAVIGRPVFGAAVGVAFGAISLMGYYAVDAARRRRSKRRTTVPPTINLDTFNAMHGDANHYRRREGWIAICEPEAGMSPVGEVALDAGVRLRVKGPDGDPFSLYRCDVFGPQGDAPVAYEDTDSDDMEFLPSIHPRVEHSVRWPDQFTPPVPDPMPSGAYWVGWRAERGGRWLFLASATFTVTPGGEFQC